jgi:chromosome segregation ATPase
VQIALILLVGVTLLLLVWWLQQRLLLRRQRTLVSLLDEIDGLEAQLHECRRRMHSLQDVVGQVPADISAVAMASLDSGEQVRLALRDVLEHRLWIQRHGEEASMQELRDALDSVARSRERLATHLAQLVAAGRDLEDACGASSTLVEPPADTRRSGEHDDT